MRTKNFAAMAFLGLALTFVSGTALAQTPDINIPDSALQAETLPLAYVQQIVTRIKYCLDIVGAAKDSKEVLRVTGILSDSYNRYDSAGYRGAYAQSLSELCTPALAKLRDDQVAPGDSTRRAVMLAISLSQVPEMSMLPCLEAMVANPSAGVRYFGWKGFLNGGFRGKVMAIGEKPTKEMMDLLARQFKVETSSVIVGLMLDMLRIPAVTADSESAYKLAVQAAWAITQQAWPSLCLRVLGGDGEMSRACRQGVDTIKYLYPSLEKADDKTAALQMLVNMMYFAAKAYDDAKAEGLLADINAQLARDCETLLVNLTGVRKDYVQKAMAISNVKERRTAVLLAVLEGWAPDLKDKGIVAPRLPASTAPETGGASVEK